eukprot:GEMP01001616.1.p1 GENE.GEMP01001616.1~~GEMP01001616.1.p1  ORF type:complete len:1378 (+),score=295.78 GEMP01001616.1:37-4170(+)
MTHGDDIIVHGGWAALIRGRYRLVSWNVWRKIADDGKWDVLFPTADSGAEGIFIEIAAYLGTSETSSEQTTWAVRPTSRTCKPSNGSDTSSTKSSESGEEVYRSENSKVVPIYGVLAYSHETARHPAETHYWYLQDDLERTGKQWSLSYDFSVAYSLEPRAISQREPGRDIFMDGLKVLFGENASIPELPMDEGRHVFYVLMANDRLIVVKGGTGCGKSTRIPLYILAQNKDAKIIVTQPRRLGAKRLAEQVNKLTSVGSKERRVAGYRVGGDKSDNSGAPIQYVTVDYMLVRIIHNPGCLKEFTHIMLDEMHERGSEAEFLFMIIRTLLSTQELKHIKLILTSATLQDTFLDFFNPLLGRPVTINNPMPIITVQARSAWKVDELFYDDLIAKESRFYQKLLACDQFKRLMIDEAPHKAFPHMDKTPADLNALTDYIAKMAIESVKVAAQVILKLAEEFWEEPDRGGGRPREVWSHQTVLVFVPGAAELTDLDEELKRELTSSTSYGKIGKYINHKNREFRRRTCIYWLHSQFPQQMEGFDSPFESNQEFRVLLATNIAETGITIPCVSAVVDMGLERTSYYEARLCMKQLILTICSKASAIQRKGRTGRTCNGVNIRLFSRAMYDHMKDFTPPGTERQDATKLALRAAQVAPKLPRNQLYCGARISRGDNRVERVSYFDNRCKQWVVHHAGKDGGTIHLLDGDDVTVMHPLEASPLNLIDLLATTPTTTQIGAAFADLEQLGCTRDGEITAMGAYSLRLPLDVQAAKLVFLAHTAFSCTLDGILIAAAMAVLDSHGDCLKNPRVMRDEDVKMDDLRMTMQAHQRRMELNTYMNENVWLESEPMALAHLLIKVLQENPKWSAKQAILSTQLKPNKTFQPFTYMVQKKSWAEYIEMAAKITDCLMSMVVPARSHRDMETNRETTLDEASQELDSFYQLLNNETMFADGARMDLSAFKITSEPKRLVALIGCATGSKFLMYGAGKNDMDTFLSSDREVVAWTHEEDDITKIKMDPARTIRINVTTHELSESREGSKVPKTELHDEELAKFFANILADTLYERDLGMIQQMKDHFMRPENIKRNLVQFPPFDSSSMGRQSRVFLEVVLRLRLQHSWNSSFFFLNGKRDVKYCISQAPHERPNKVKWNYVFPNQNQQHFEASAEIRACASTMQHSRDGGGVKWAVASSARNKRFAAADSITMQGITVLQESSALLWILCGRPFPEGVKLLLDQTEGLGHCVWGAMFHGDYQLVSKPANLKKVNKFRDLWGQVCDRKFHAQAGGITELRKGLYQTEYVGQSLHLVSVTDRHDIITDKDKIDVVRREMTEVVGHELQMIHPHLLQELKDAVSDLLQEARRLNQPPAFAESTFVGAVGALENMA